MKRMLVGNSLVASLLALDDRWVRTTTHLIPPPDFQLLDLEVELQGRELFSRSGSHRSLPVGRESR